MHRTLTSIARLVAPSFAALATLSAPAVAHAGIDACGNIDVQANARCRVETTGGCTAQCEPVRFEAACSGKLQATCDGRCNNPIEVSCTATCSGSCEAECRNVTAPSFDCRGRCEARCDGDCTGKCATSGNKSECEASCRATCSGSCEGTCQATPPSADCRAKCDASCSGSCEARANLDCQVTCQSEGMLACKSQLTGGCQTQCAKPEGALFCEGQYVDTGNNLQSCIDALRAQLNVKVEGSAECQGNECSAGGSASASCAMARTGSPGEPLDPRFLLAGVGALAFSIARRRRG